MLYRIALSRSDDGVRVRAPALPEFHAHGRTEEEAIANITAAIAGYLADIDKQLRGQELREIFVPDKPRDLADEHAAALELIAVGGSAPDMDYIPRRRLVPRKRPK